MDDQETNIVLRVRMIHPDRKPPSPPGIISAIVLFIGAIIMSVARMPTESMVMAVGFAIVTTIMACAQYIVREINNG